MTRMTLTVTVVLLSGGLLLAGCKDDDEVPEHERQAKRQAAELKKKRARKKKQAARSDAGADEYRTWTKRVQQAYYQLYRARGRSVPQAAQMLARLGLPAAPALRRISMADSQDKKKRAVASFLLVDLYMFRPDDLRSVAESFDVPYGQRAAIQALARIANPTARAHLDALARTFREIAPEDLDAAGRGAGGGAGEGAGQKTGEGAEGPAGERVGKPPEGNPMLAFLEQAREKAPEKWRYTADQLEVLDTILQSDNLSKLRVALTEVEDLSLEQGLLALMRSPVSRELTQVGVAFKLIELAGDDRRRLRRMCAREQPRMLRIQAARRLLEGGRKPDVAFVRKLAASDKDPLAKMFTRMLDSRVKQPR